MKLEDAIFSLYCLEKRLGTCFAVEINGKEFIITCKHIFDGIPNFEKKSILIVDSKYNFTATVIDVSNDADIVILIPDNKLSCAKLYLFPKSTFVEYSIKLGMYGYCLDDESFSGMPIDSLKYIAQTPYGNLAINIPEASREKVKEGLSGSPLIWDAERTPGTVFGMFIGSSARYGDANFISSEEICDFINNSKKIKCRKSFKKKGTIPDIEGIWEFCLNDKSTILQINNFEDVYSRGYIHIFQDEDELHGTAINLLFINRLHEKLIATYIYEIIGAKIIEEQFGTVSLEATCHLSSRTYLDFPRFNGHKVKLGCHSLQFK